VNAQTGKQAWVQNLDGAVLGSPVLGTGKTLYVGSYGGTVYAINTTTGEAQISQKASSWIWSGPVLDGNMLYFGDGNGALFAHPVAGTDQPWKQTVTGAIVGTPLVIGDNIVVGTEAGNVYFIDRAGKNLRPISISGKVYSSPVAAGSLILVAPTGGNAILVAFDQTGAVKWSFIPAK
jgi:outer membrane protein assembly factor BamB